VNHPTQILVVDDHALFRESLVRLLESEPDLQVVAHCDSVARARDVLCRDAVDLVLLDYDLGEESGASLLHELQRRAERTRVLVVTGGISDVVTLDLLSAGAAGVFYKHREPAQLMEAIRRISRGELWLDSVAVRSLIADIGKREEERRDLRQLSLRQQEVLASILEGHSNKEIAWKLQLSMTTVKVVVQELFEKAGVQTRSQLVRVALQKHAADWLAGGKVHD
jgi:two-component system, NarL family, nitrate/nitrite response regulator NarL